MGRIAIPDRFDYEYEYRPPQRTEYEYDEEARTILCPEVAAGAFLTF
jgi:hypothetical protein